MTRCERSDQFREAELAGLDMSRATFREVDLSGVRMRGVLLTGADIDGDIRGLRLNGVEVAPLVEAELDRQHPERTQLRPTTADGMRTAWAVVESFWAATMRRAGQLPEADLHRSVDGEWSFAETLRHLLFVTDAWFGHAVLGEARPFHPLGLPASFFSDVGELGVDPAARPVYADVVAARAGRVAAVRDFLAAATQEDLDRVRAQNPAPGWPPPQPRTAISCLHVLLNEEWAHHQFAIRDLAVIEAGAP
ncbi:MAG TPA: DinB family protein [Micromonosporaceae bacterium]|nr:DinB family protein [Micromonosporaceae bacterium]